MVLFLAHGGVRWGEMAALRVRRLDLLRRRAFDIQVVQQMLGHKSATMTLDQYGHLFGDWLDTVADAMDAPRTSALASGYPTGPEGRLSSCQVAETGAG